MIRNRRYGTSSSPRSNHLSMSLKHHMDVNLIPLFMKQTVTIIFINHYRLLGQKFLSYLPALPFFNF